MVRVYRATLQGPQTRRLTAEETCRTHCLQGYITNPISTRLACSQLNEAAGIFELNTAPIYLTVYNPPHPLFHPRDVKHTQNYILRPRIYPRRHRKVTISPRKKNTTLCFFAFSRPGPPEPVPIVCRHLPDYHRRYCRCHESVLHSGQERSTFADPTQCKRSEWYRWLQLGFD